MTNEERWILYQSPEFRREISVDLLDWAGYWSEPGVIETEITDELLKIQTRSAVRIITTDLGRATKILAALVISDDDIKISVIDVDHAVIKRAIDNAMARKLEWLTGIDQIQEQE